jgi:tripartite-type tricarboxylate transporter receptor subunit TctC
LGTSVPLEIIVGFAPGTAPGTNARLLSSKLQESWPAGVIVANKPGAGGTLAVAAALAAPSDGTTLLWGTNG